MGTGFSTPPGPGEDQGSEHPERPGRPKCVAFSRALAPLDCLLFSARPRRLLAVLPGASYAVPVEQAGNLGRPDLGTAVLRLWRLCRWRSQLRQRPRELFARAPDRGRRRWASCRACFRLCLVAKHALLATYSDKETSRMRHSSHQSGRPCPRPWRLRHRRPRPGRIPLFTLNGIAPLAVPVTDQEEQAVEQHLNADEMPAQPEGGAPQQNATKSTLPCAAARATSRRRELQMEFPQPIGRRNRLALLQVRYARARHPRGSAPL